MATKEKREKAVMKFMQELGTTSGSGCIWHFPCMDDFEVKDKKNNRLIRVLCVIEDFFVKNDGKKHTGPKHFYVIFKFQLPEEYPFKAPAISAISETGRLTPCNNLCTTFSHFHSESWKPTWTLRRMIVGLLSAIDDNTINGVSWENHNPERIKQAMIKFEKELKNNRDKYTKDFDGFGNFLENIDDLNSIRGKEKR